MWMFCHMALLTTQSHAYLSYLVLKMYFTNPPNIPEYLLCENQCCLGLSSSTPVQHRMNEL